MDKNQKLATAVRMLKVAEKTVQEEYVKGHVSNIYAKDSAYRKACYRADKLSSIVQNLGHELGLI